MSTGDFSALAIFILIASAAIATVISLVYILNHKGEKLKFDLRLLLKIYVYIVMAITLVTGVVGLAQLGKASFSYVFGYEFSYSMWEVVDPVPADVEMGETKAINSGSTIEIDGRKYQTDYEQRKNDLVIGASFFVSSTILFAIHRYILKFFMGDKEDEAQLKVLQRIYVIANLILFSIASILLIPGAIYSVANFYLYDPESVEYYSRVVPGEILALAIVVVPVWLWFLNKALRLYKKEK